MLDPEVASLLVGGDRDGELVFKRMLGTLFMLRPDVYGPDTPEAEARWRRELDWAGLVVQSR